MQNDLLPDAIEMTMRLTNAGFTGIKVEDKQTATSPAAQKGEFY